MRIRFQSEGGIAAFPGLNKPIEVHTEQLSGDQRAELEGLVNGADVFNQPEVVGSAAPGAADYRVYTVSVQDGARQHTLRVIEPAADPNLRRLIERLRTLARSQRGT